LVGFSTRTSLWIFMHIFSNLSEKCRWVSFYIWSILKRTQQRVLNWQSKSSFFVLNLKWGSETYLMQAILSYWKYWFEPNIWVNVGQQSVHMRIVICYIFHENIFFPYFHLTGQPLFHRIFIVLKLGKQTLKEIWNFLFIINFFHPLTYWPEVKMSKECLGL
jgi:hypothetical protein